MENKKIPSFAFGVIAIILGWTLIKHFDFQNLSFQKPLLDALYLIVFVFSIYTLIKNYKNRTEK
jgi:membrane protein DedA with SNARE-associated domain